MSNDYKSMLGFWNKLTLLEKQKFITENISSSLTNGVKTQEVSEEQVKQNRLRDEINLAMLKRNMEFASTNQ